jgi:serine/threonine protein kinase
MDLSEEELRSVILPPAALDRYRIVGAIGSGGMGAVYRADDALLQRPVAIKVLRATSRRESACQQLLGEVSGDRGHIPDDGTGGMVAAFRNHRKGNSRSRESHDAGSSG